jgi:hypothetical protein
MLRVDYGIDVPFEPASMTMATALEAPDYVVVERSPSPGTLAHARPEALVEVAVQTGTDSVDWRPLDR